ncbi:MAG: hypothetical protein H5U13_12750 [Parvibaculum sp.]|nr:hypothetical protein [Parvibaculum sp.]
MIGNAGARIEIDGAAKRQDTVEDEIGGPFLDVNRRHDGADDPFLAVRAGPGAIGKVINSQGKWPPSFEKTSRTSTMPQGCS